VCQVIITLISLSLGRRHPRLESEVKPRIMYIENKAAGLSGSARIRTGNVLENRQDSLLPRPHVSESKGRGFKANYVDVATGEEYWISGPKKNGADGLYGGRSPVEIDDEVREEYWRSIRACRPTKSRN